MKKIIKTKSVAKIDIDELTLRRREIFLFEYVTEESMVRLIKEILILDNINHKPITFHINSGGGSCTDGLALINVMRQVKSPIITIVNMEACSMGSQISIAGDARKIVSNGFLMFHDMTNSLPSYSGKIKYRAKYIEKLWDTLVATYTTHTKLSKKDLEIARNGELWLTAEESLAKGCVDEII